jgi:hypothetical protein
MNVLYSSQRTFKVETKRRLIRIKTAERLRQVTVRGWTALSGAADGVHLCTAVSHVGLFKRLCVLNFVAVVFLRAN